MPGWRKRGARQQREREREVGFKVIKKKKTLAHIRTKRSTRSRTDCDRTLCGKNKV